MRLWIGVIGIAVALLWMAWIAPDTPEEAAKDRHPGQALGILVLWIGSTVLALVHLVQSWRTRAKKAKSVS